MSITGAFNNAVANRGAPQPTAISLIVDRSGSMVPYISSVVNSVFKFISEQKEIKGSASFTLAQFDDEYDVIFKDRDIAQIDASQFQRQYSPRGGTAFRDAIVQSVRDMENYLKGIPAADQPKRKVIALITDGDDNMSRHSADQVKQIIQDKEKLGWDFMLLGAESNTLKVAKELGISEKKTARYSIDNPDAAIKLLSDKVKQARRGKQVEINQQERLLLLGDGKKTDL